MGLELRDRQGIPAWHETAAARAGSGLAATPLAGSAGVLLRICSECRGSGQSVPSRAVDEAAPPGWRWPIALLSVGLTLTGITIGLSFPLRGQPGFEWLMVLAAGGLTLSVVGSQLTLERAMDHYGHVKIPKWATLAILLVLSAALVVIFSLARG
jgi:hypothetical protein